MATGSELGSNPGYGWTCLDKLSATQVRKGRQRRPTRSHIPGTLSVAEALGVHKVSCDTLMSDTSLDQAASCPRKPDKFHTF